MNAQIINKIVETCYNETCAQSKLLVKLLTKKMEKINTPEDAFEVMTPLLQKNIGDVMDEDLYDEEWKENLEMWIDAKVEEVEEEEEVETEYEDSVEYTPYEQSTFSFIKDEMNVDILEDYVSKHPTEVRNNFMVKGAVQSGKTKTLLAHALASTVQGVRNVFIVRNITEDKYQLMNAMKKITEKHQKYVNDDVFETGVSMECVDINGLSKWINPRNDVRNIVLLANGSQVSKFMDNTEGMKFNLFIDEADQFLEGEKNKKVELSLIEELSKIMKLANKKFVISATTFSLIFKENLLHTANTIQVNTPNNYHGIEYLTHQEVENGKVEGETEVMKAHPGLVEAIYSINRKTKPINGCGLKKAHPHILLAKVSTKKDDHTDIIDFIYSTKRTQKRWATIIFNGEGVEIGHHSLNKDEMKMKNGEDTVEGVLRKNNCYTFKGMGIQAALSFLKKNGGVERFSHILIASGKLADRGINFVSDDYEWHINNEYLHMSKTATCAATIQSLRILGCHNDTMDLTLWATKDVYSSIQKYHTLDKSIIAAGKKQHEEWTDLLKKFKVSKERLPSMKLCKRNRKFKVVSDSKKDNLERVEIEWSGDILERDGLERIRNAWEKKTGIVYKIIKLYVDNDFKSMSKKELDTCGKVKIDPKHYMEWNGSSKGRVRIIEKHGDEFVLRAQIINELDIKF